jgi:hypothetical protein
MSTDKVLSEKAAYLGSEFAAKLYWEAAKIIDSNPDGDLDRPILYRLHEFMGVWGIETACRNYGATKGFLVSVKDKDDTTTLEPVFERHWEETAKYYAEVAVWNVIFKREKAKFYPAEKKWEQKCNRAADEAVKVYRTKIS